MHCGNGPRIKVSVPPPLWPKSSMHQHIVTRDYQAEAFGQGKVFPGFSRVLLPKNAHSEPCDLCREPTMPFQNLGFFLRKATFG